ncbi:MAG: ACP phosphodiesterase [Phycisphaeraceae bacterium]
MNFLAHLHLADATPASWVGNLLPDLVRGRLPDDLHPDVAAGVRTHRGVDAFTDTHPLVARSKERLRPAHGRFAGILVDVFYDHFLARDWHRFHHAPLQQFTGEVHGAFAAHPHLMPESMRDVVVRMREQDWLCIYAQPAGIELTLRRMSRRFSERLRRRVCLEQAMVDLHAHEQALADDFARFFPQLVAWVEARQDTADAGGAPRTGASTATLGSVPFQG